MRESRKWKIEVTGRRDDGRYQKGEYRNDILFQGYRKFDFRRNHCRVDGWMSNWRSRLHSVFVFNLSCKVITKLAWDVFSDYGKVADVYIQVPKDSNRSRLVTFGFVRYWKEAEAKEAIVRANNRFMEGVRIRTAIANPTRASIGKRNNDKGDLPTKEDSMRRIRDARVDGRSYRDVVVAQFIK